MRNHEVTDRQRLLDEKGNIREPGWARSQVWTYSRADIKAPDFRIKEWDYYIVIHDGRLNGTESFAAAFTISDNGYVGLQSVSLLRLDEGAEWEHTETVLNSFPMGKMNLPSSSREGDVIYRDNRLKMRFHKESGKRRIQCRFEKFCDKKSLAADITLLEPEMDTMVIATPWDKTERFTITRRSTV